MREIVHAYCLASGHIRFDAAVPEDGIPLAVGPRADLQCLVLGLAAMSRVKPALAVPGLAEAADDAARRAAVVRFKERIDAAINQLAERELADVRRFYAGFHACFQEAAAAEDDDVFHPPGARVEARFFCTLPVRASEREVCAWLEHQLGLMPWIAGSDPLAVRSVTFRMLAVSIEPEPAPVDLRRLPS